MPWWLWVYLIVAGMKLVILAAMAIGGSKGDADQVVFGIVVWPLIWVLEVVNIVLKYFSS